MNIEDSSQGARDEMKICLAILLTISVALVPRAHAQTELPGKLVQQIPLPVEGWMDHLSVDVRGQRLFIPAEHQRSIEIVDLRAGKAIHSITGFTGFPRKNPRAQPNLGGRRRNGEILQRRIIRASQEYPAPDRQGRQDDPR
jgi:hypothetical protein